MSYISFTATGDSFITRKFPDKKLDAFTQLSTLMKKADVRFTNLEVTTHHYEGYPSAVSGGTWAIAPPHVINELISYGFNVLAWANNHTLDYSHGGLIATKKYLDESEIVHSGVGMNLAEASEPKYLETSSGRVALIACTSTFQEGADAGEQRPDLGGRPGVNPLRYEISYQVPRKALDTLEEIAEKAGINADQELMIKEGFATEDGEGTVTFGEHQFSEGNEFKKSTKPLEKDVERIKRSIEEAKRQADYVLLSMHFHEMEGREKNRPAEFARMMARVAIDCGAHSVIGHGPHVMRGVEIYKKRPIFYSLGNFIFQNETVSHLPSDFYSKYALGHDHNVADALDTRTENNTKGLGVNPHVWRSVVPYWTMAEGELVELKFYPIELGFEEPRYKKGWPKLSRNPDIMAEFKQLSVPFGTRMKIEDGVGMVKL